MYNVQNSATAPIHCVAQNYGALSVSRYSLILVDTVQRNANMIRDNVVCCTRVLLSDIVESCAGTGQLELSRNICK